MERELALLNQQVVQVMAPTQEARRLLAQRDEEKTKFDQERSDRSAIFTAKAALESEITAVKKAMDVDQCELIREITVAARVAESKAKNDKHNVEKTFADLQVKKAKLNELEALLATGVACPEKDAIVKKLEEKKLELAQAKDDITLSFDDKEGKVSTLEAICRIVDDHRDAYQKEFGQYDSLIAEENETYSAFQRQMEQESLSFEQQALTSESIFRELDRKFKLYRYGVKLFKKTKEKVAKVEAALLAKNKDL